MTKRLIARVGLVKVYRDSEWNEFQIVGPDKTTAYDDDKDSAMGTAQALARFFGVPLGLGLDSPDVAAVALGLSL